MVDPLVLGGLALGLLLIAVLGLLWSRRGEGAADDETEERESPRESRRVKIRSAAASGDEDRSARHRIKPLNEADAAEDIWDDDDDDELTVLRVEVDKHRRPSQPPQASAEVIFFDEGSEVDVPTKKDVALLTSATAQSDPGKRRRRNEDRYLQLDAHHVYAVADGIGGHAGGHIAAELAVETLREAFEERRFDAEVTGAELPWRAEELVKAVQRANLAVYERGRREKWLREMGTTLVAARFSPRKERMYLAHVGDSRCYRLRDGKLRLLTTDHTFGALGVVEDGPTSAALSRAVGATPDLTIDVIIAEPKVGDRFLLCTDGLTRMVDEETVAHTLGEAEDIADSASALVEEANDQGGDDNVTVVVVEVCTPTQLIRLDERRRKVS